MISFEVFDNAFQLFVLACATIVSLFLTMRHKKRHFFILTLGYASFFMGTLFYLLNIAIRHDIPHVGYVSEISWTALYFFFVSLQIVRCEGLRIRFSLIPALFTAPVVSHIVHFHIMGPALIMAIIFACAAGALTYISIYRMFFYRKLTPIDICFTLCTVLQISLYVRSAFTADFTHFNAYFAIDILLTLSYVCILPFTAREVLEK